MESTFMKTTTRAANLRSKLDEPEAKEALAEFVETWHDISGEDERGMRLDSVLRSLSSFVVPDLSDGRKAQGKTSVLDQRSYTALLKKLNSDAGTALFVDSSAAKRGGQRHLRREAQSHSDIIIRGIHFRPQCKSRRDSNIQFGSPEDPRAGSIQQIVTHRRKTPEGEYIEETFLVVEELVQLSNSHREHDLFRKFPFAGGRLYYERGNVNLVVLRPSDSLCHVAKTPLVLTSIPEPTVHILPLDRVRSGPTVRYLRCSELTVSSIVNENSPDIWTNGPCHGRRSRVAVSISY